MDRDVQSEETNAWLDNIMISEFVPLGEPIVFNDEVLKADVLDLIGKCTANSDSRYSHEEVYANEVKDVERFQVHHDVTDITGLEHFAGLKYFAVTAADVSDISPMSKLQHLEIVIFYGIPITDITALNTSGQSGQLKILTLQGLALTQTVLETINTWVGIERLDLEGTPLESLDFLPSGGNLWQLVLNDTGVTDISALSNQSGLKTLLLNNNEIEDLDPIAGLEQLEYLYADNTGLEDITAIEDMKQLKRLSLNSNAITDITSIVQGPINSLERVLIENNYLDLTEGSEDMNNIQTLIAAGIDIDYEPQKNQ